MKKILLSLTLVTAFIFPASAQEEVPAPSRKPLAAMQKLEQLVGTWEQLSEYSPDNGKTWQKSPPARVEFSFRQKGLMLAEIPLDTHQPGFHLETFFGYDQYREVYRLVAIDDMWGLVDLYEGNIEDGKLVVTNLNSCTFFPIGPDQWRAFRISLDLHGAERKMVVDKSDDGGKTWQDNFRITYKKL